GTVHRDAVALIGAAAADVAAVDERGAGGVDLRHEGVLAAVVGQVRPDGHGKRGLRGGGRSRDVRVARAVHRDGIADVAAAAADKAAVVERGAGSAELRHEGDAEKASGGKKNAEQWLQVTRDGMYRLWSRGTQVTLRAAK